MFIWTHKKWVGLTWSRAIVLNVFIMAVGGCSKISLSLVEAIVEVPPPLNKTNSPNNRICQNIALTTRAADLTTVVVRIMFPWSWLLSQKEAVFVTVVALRDQSKQFGHASRNATGYDLLLRSQWFFSSRYWVWPPVLVPNGTRMTALTPMSRVILQNKETCVICLGTATDPQDGDGGPVAKFACGCAAVVHLWCARSYVKATHSFTQCLNSQHSVCRILHPLINILTVRDPSRTVVEFPWNTHRHYRHSFLSTKLRPIVSPIRTATLGEVDG